MCIRFNVRDRSRAAAPWICGGLMVFAMSMFTAPVSAAEICPPADPPTCLAQCYHHKRECWRTCNERKRQCIAEARLEAQACRLECRDSASVEDPGVCRRRCVASALRQAVEECKLGRPVCLEECNPQACGRRCDASADLAAEVCEPPVDLECFGVCARQWRACLERVRRDGRECASRCSDYRGEERTMCLRRCAEKVRTGAQTCTQNFRSCAALCWDSISDSRPDSVPPAD